jgi:hypothetical protein
VTLHEAVAMIIALVLFLMGILAAAIRAGCLLQKVLDSIAELRTYGSGPLQEHVEDRRAHPIEEITALRNELSALRNDLSAWKQTVEGWMGRVELALNGHLRTK